MVVIAFPGSPLEDFPDRHDCPAADVRPPDSPGTRACTGGKARSKLVLVHEVAKLSYDIERAERMETAHMAGRVYRITRKHAVKLDSRQRRKSREAARKLLYIAARPSSGIAAACRRCAASCSARSMPWARCARRNSERRMSKA